MRESRNAEINALSDANKKQIADFKATEQEKLRISRDTSLQRISAAQAFAATLAGVEGKALADALDSHSGVTAFEEALGRQINSAQEFVIAMTEAGKAAHNMQLTLSQNALGEQQRSALQGEVGKLLAELQARVNEGAARVVEGGAEQAINNQLQGMIDSFRQLQESGELTAENLNAIAGQGKEVQDAIGKANDFLNNAGRAFNPALEQASSILARMQQLATIPPAKPVDTAALTQLQAVLSQQPAAQFGSATASMSAAVGPTQAIASGWERAAAAAERAAAAAARAAAARSNQAFGGMTHLAAGGAARGIDTIPAMLSPGEFVMNARSSRKFYAQLQAMNAGQAPTFRENGGSVTQNQFGDINIAGQAASNPQQSAREMIRQINRETRRGTARLN